MFAIPLKRLVLSFLVLGFGNSGNTQSINQNVPSMYPGGNCLVRGGDEASPMPRYNFLTSDDCSGIFVRPPLVSPQLITYSVSGSLRLCGAIQSIDERVLMSEKDISSMHRKLSKLFVKVPANDYQQAKLERQIKYYKEQIELVTKIKNSDLQDKDRVYGSMPGATFSITLDSEVRARDLVTLAEKNYYPVAIQVEGKPEIVYKRPKVTKAEPSDSFYSFFYRTADTRDPHGSVITSHVPGEIYSQSNDKMGVVHVYANEGLSAEMVLNLPSICVGAKEESPGKWVLDETRSTPIFTVNRTYTIDQRIPFSYESSLKQDILAARIINYVKTAGNDGFSLSQVLGKRFVKDLDKYIHFLVMDGGSQVGLDKQKVLKKQVFVEFLSHYLDQLVEKNILKIVDVQSLRSGESSFFDNRTLKKDCLSSSVSGNCYNNVYAFVSWTGEVNDQVRSAMTAVEGLESSVTINEMVPITYTSTFLPRLEKNN